MPADRQLPWPLRKARVHEVFGPGARAFAAVFSAAARGDVLWLRESWHGEMINPGGLCRFLDVSRLLMGQVPTQADGLAVMEEALRDGVIPAVVLELTRPLDPKQGRRLQLAAKTGETTGLCLIPEGMGSNAAETRWHVAPFFDPQADSTPMRWEITKNKQGTLGVWNVRWDDQTHRLHVVPPAGD
ncbi:protein ImuA [Poseidonocella pacifica]|uniref:Protein ImuA n=1 Tax=Poseidonocella pacifica TaxID=871651 RepID=A0A1I0WRU7_9RHOB|nr:hypothetical protein [Poseidonocella pacifica]SFA91492.1 protein ImuA [Poseidonocella pacifica]